MNNRNSRIVRNTFFLYLRMLFSMGVAFYSSRIILNVLGIVDYGIYNVVGSVSVMFSFLNAAMATSTQRFLSYEIGRNDYEKLKVNFDSSVVIHLIIASFILLLAETVGLWFLKTKMTIPIDRLNASISLYQCCILIFLITVIQSPYNALLLAFEKMNVYSYIGIIDVLLKLIFVISLQYIYTDRLILYGILLLIVSIINISITFIYCYRKYPISHFRFNTNIANLKNMFSYATWNLFGDLALLLSNQGVNIVLNIFFGPLINAARGIAFQINSAVQSLVINFQIAVKPQIVKSYACKENEYMLSLVYISSKFSFFLVVIIAIPLLLSTEQILNMWLKIVPDYSIMFCRLIIINVLIDCFSGPLAAAAQATGKIKKYQFIVGLILMTNLPISYFILKYYKFPEIVFYISILLSIIALFSRLLLLSKMILLDSNYFLKNVLFRSIVVFLIVLFVTGFLSRFIPFPSIQILSIIIMTIILVPILVFYIGLNKSQKHYVKIAINNLLKKKFFDRLI